ncbi:MAG: hypothetical protein WC919_06100, partial [Candidatus Paceibacterota bacterium]
MRNFDKLLESALSSVKTSKSPRTELWRLEQALKQADARCCTQSGMGERYFHAAITRMNILRKISKYRPLNDWEQKGVEQGEKIIRKYHPQSAKLYGLTESNESRLMVSVLQKLDAMPQNMPYNSIWTGIDVVMKRFGLTPEEARALSASKAYKRTTNGYEVDRPTLKLLATRPDV